MGKVERFTTTVYWLQIPSVQTILLQLREIMFVLVLGQEVAIWILKVPWMRLGSITVRLPMMM